MCESRFSEQQMIGVLKKHQAQEAARRANAGCAATLRELAAERRRFGYRRRLILLRWDGFMVKHKRRASLLARPGKITKTTKATG